VYDTQAVEEVEKSDIGKKGKDVVEGLGRTAQRTAETIGKSSEQLAKTEVYRRVSEVHIKYCLFLIRPPFS